MNDLWIILTAILVASSSAILGSFLIMRKMAMIGDAISHAVLPGIVIAYFITQNRTGLPILAGAAATGLIVTWFIQFFNRIVKLQIDASIGISYTFLFAVGIILISLFGSNVDLDQECVLYGEIAYVPLDMWFIGDTSLGPRQFWILLANLVLVGGAVFAAYKQLFITSFDESYASAIGIPVLFWQYYLMGGVSLTTVVSFESVGAILVIAFLVGPPATAYLVTERFKKMIGLSVLFGIIASFIGYYLAVALNASIAGSITAVIGLEFTIAFLYSSWKRKWVNKHRLLETGILQSAEPKSP